MCRIHGPLIAPSIRIRRRIPSFGPLLLHLTEEGRSESRSVPWGGWIITLRSLPRAVGLSSVAVGCKSEQVSSFSGYFATAGFQVTLWPELRGKDARAQLFPLSATTLFLAFLWPVRCGLILCCQG